MTGNHHENIACTVQAITEIRTNDQTRRKLDAREIANIFALRHHGLKQVEFDNPAKTNITARACEL
jgi:hypothetical protein